MMNMNRHIVTITNEESLNIPSFPKYMKTEAIHYYVDVGGVYEDTAGNDTPGEDIASK